MESGGVGVPWEGLGQEGGVPLLVTLQSSLKEMLVSTLFSAETVTVYSIFVFEGMSELLKGPGGLGVLSILM